MLYIDIKYVGFLSTHLERFVRKGDYLWNMRCPVCGDSEHSKQKARGYIYKRKDALFYKCHNCSYGTTISKFIKLIDQNLYNEYRLENYKQTNNEIVKPQEYKPVVVEQKIDLNLPSIDELHPTHYALKYVIERKIPEEYWSILYFSEDFEKWAMGITTGTYKEKYHGHTEPRLVIPFFDRTGDLVAVQGRSLVPCALRYITIKFQEDAQKVFGLERWNKNEKTYLVEGPLDSLFLPNALAMAGTAAAVVDTLFENKQNTTVVFDNEKSNREIVDRMMKSADAGYSVCVWPNNIKEKDINDLVLSGHSSSQITDIIDSNTYTGLQALLNINKWKRY